MGCLFFLTLNGGFSALSNVSQIFPSERPVFLREVNNGMYRVSAYFWAKILSEFPAAIVIPLIQSAIVYWLVGLNNEVWYKFPTFLLNFILLYNSFGGFGYILGAAISDKQVVNIITPVLVVPLMLFAGFFVNQESIPLFLTPIKYISIFRYGFQGYMLNEFTDLNLACETSVDLKDRCDPLGDFKSPQTLAQSI